MERAPLIPAFHPAQPPDAVRAFFRPSRPDPSGYIFTDGHGVELDPSDEIAPVYAAGYLPASHLLHEPPRQFYRARSLRYDLAQLKFNKKSRYLHRKGDRAGFKWHHGEEHRILEALSPDWEAQVLEWVRHRFDPPYIERERLSYIRQHRAYRDLAYVSRGEDIVAIIILPRSGSIAHYWFAFLDFERCPDASLGRWCIGAAADALRRAGLQHLYVGTAYQPSAAYKLSGITAGLEWFDGHTWRSDRAQLEALLRRDTQAF